MTDPAPATPLLASVSLPQQRVLWRLAQHKYGWGYVTGLGLLAAARALQTRGLVEVSRSEQGDWLGELTDAGHARVAELFPSSPAVLRTYTRPEGGWSPCPA